MVDHIEIRKFELKYKDAQCITVPEGTKFFTALYIPGFVQGNIFLFGKVPVDKYMGNECRTIILTGSDKKIDNDKNIEYVRYEHIASGIYPQTNENCPVEDWHVFEEIDTTKEFEYDIHNEQPMNDGWFD